MHVQSRGLVAKAWGRVRQWSGWLSQRLRGGPSRRSERTQVQAPEQDWPLPPGRLMHLVGNTDDPDWFLGSGYCASQDLRSLLIGHNVPLPSLGAVLDFGCGVGRVIRHWADLPEYGVEVIGTDTNPKLIAWCRQNLTFARFAVNRLDGQIAAEDNTIGLAYAFSVFTHLSESYQQHWMRELARVLRPGGLLLLTVHGDAYRSELTAEPAERFDRGELVVVGTHREGSNHCVAFHPPGYVTSNLAAGWHLLEFQPRAARGNPYQDVYLLRKPFET